MVDHVPGDAIGQEGSPKGAATDVSGNTSIQSRIRQSHRSPVNRPIDHVAGRGFEMQAELTGEHLKPLFPPAETFGNATVAHRIKYERHVSAESDTNRFGSRGLVTARSVTGNEELQVADDTLSPTAPRVLVVDDQASMAMLMSRVIESMGCSVDTAADGEEALECGMLNTYDLVLLDQWLPGLQGVEVLTAWRNAGRGFPVILVSGDAGPDELVDKLGLTRVDFMRKPFDIPDLMSLVDTYLRRAA